MSKEYIFKKLGDITVNRRDLMNYLSQVGTETIVLGIREYQGDLLPGTSRTTLIVQPNTGVFLIEMVEATIDPDFDEDDPDEVN